MPKTTDAFSALLAVFPTPASYRLFSESGDNAQILETIVAFAYRNGVIDAAESSFLEKFISENERAEEVCTPPSRMTFESFFDQKEKVLDLNLSARALADRINALLAEHGIELPKVSNSMLSRLKKEKADTPHKQNVLRSFAFWLGHDRAHLGPQWNFETLCKLCQGGRQQVDYKEGVRIGFALYSRGDVIDHDIVGWLKKELKTYIEQAIGRFAYGRWGKVRAHDITTLYVDFPKEERAGNPFAYRQCLRSALSLAHQMAIRWALSDSYSQNRFLSIGIAAGSLISIDNHLLPILNAKLPGDPVIRMTDYARQCVLINDIRALLSPHPAEITLFNDETLSIWWMVGVWSTLYFDFIPDLLRDTALQNDIASTTRFAGIVWPSLVDSVPDDHDDQDNPPNAVSTFLRVPHNSLLGLEIAKTLYYRRRFWDAIEILRIVLSLDPTHLNARTLRMVLLRNLAVDAPSYAASDGLFEQAYKEASFIQHNCDFQSEDFYCEHAVVYLAQAMSTLRYLRKGNGTIDGETDTDQFKQRIFEGLDQADTIFGNGISVSPTGIRANYLLNTVKVLKSILKSEDALFVDAERSIDARPAVIRKPLHAIQWQMGYLRDDLPQSRPLELMEKIFKLYTTIHDDSISLQAYRPTTYYCTAVSWWDLFPERTVATARRTIQVLKGAGEIAAKMDKEGVCIYSFTRTYGEMLPVPEFVEQMERCIQMVRDIAGGDLSRRDDQELLESGEGGRMGLLMTLNY